MLLNPIEQPAVLTGVEGGTWVGNKLIKPVGLNWLVISAQNTLHWVDTALESFWNTVPIATVQKWQEEAVHVEFFISFAWLPLVPSHIPLGSGHLGMLFFFLSSFSSRKELHLQCSFSPGSGWQIEIVIHNCELQSLEWNPLSSGPVLPWTFPIPCAMGLVSLLQEGLRFLASRPVLGDFSQKGAHHFTHGCSSNSNNLKERNPTQSFTPLVSIAFLICTDEMIQNSLCLDNLQSDVIQPPLSVYILTQMSIFRISKKSQNVFIRTSVNSLL